ncbi:hypothetical protein [Flavobacterium sp. CLA17]|uniref:hypothetical protein n=1 Tax=Flavobacterium sp. CLA17 TaxID=2724135 RepID=UPI001492ACE0|nr:hypothetical protein [Flavobacterium sp. CLA17]QSB25549.1 hypothetical protein HAV12_014335 [Flavobacterium sp. CLA17]
MDFNLKTCSIALFLSLLMISCDNKLQINNNVLFIVENFHAHKDSVLNIKIINNSNSNYYITLDTNRAYNYSAFNNKLNSNIILKSLIYSGGTLIPLRGERFVSKAIRRKKNKCIDAEIVQSDKFYKNYKTLKNAVFLKRKSSRIITIPFSLKFNTCFSSYHYDIKKNKKNELKIEYKMLKEILENDVAVKTRDSLERKGYFPYYQTIVSNKVIIFE